MPHITCSHWHNSKTTVTTEAKSHPTRMMKMMRVSTRQTVRSRAVEATTLPLRTNQMNMSLTRLMKRKRAVLRSINRHRQLSLLLSSRRAGPASPAALRLSLATKTRQQENQLMRSRATKRAKKAPHLQGAVVTLAAMTALVMARSRTKTS